MRDVSAIGDCPESLYEISYMEITLNLSQELSAENGDNFGNGEIEKSGKVAILIIY